MLITTRPEDVAVAAPDDVASAAAGVSRRARPRRTVSINRRFGLDSSKTYRKLRLGNMNMPAAAERVARSVALEQAYVYDVYEQFSDNPRSKPWPRVNQFLDNLEPGSIVCDVGCGNGKYLNANSSIYNIGGEKCVRLSKIAREKDNEVLVLDNLSLPFRDESLDAVLSIAVVHHFATTERRVCALRELARVLRIGGRLIITVWAMEQRYRKFESQDVLVPWRRPQTLSTPSLELTSTTNTSDDDGFSPYHAYTQTSDSDSIKSNKCKSGTRKRGKTKHKGRSIDPGRNSSPSSSSLSSPNETCYSFVRRAIQKLAGGKRVHHHHNHRPWFLEGWTTCGKEPKRYKHDCEYVNVQDIPIELRRVDDDDDDHNELLLVQPQRRQTFPSSQILNDLYASLKSKSMTNIRTTEPNAMTRSQSSVPSVPETDETATGTQPDQKAANDIDDESDDRPKATNKPRLVKQKQSICEEDADEALDKATDMKSVETNERLFGGRHGRGNVYKQRSLNEEELTDRRKEKERVRQNIQKQASLNEDLIYHHRHHHHHHHGIGGASIKETIFSATTAKRLQLFKSDFATKLKNSTTNIEKVAGASLKNGFVRIFQNWKSPETTVTTTAQPLTGNKEEEAAKKGAVETTVTKENSIERRPSKEDGSDSSKDSSLQSDTSVDSEDSFASVIFVPKSNPMSPNLSPGPTSPRVTAGNCSAPNSPRIKQSSCPTSPRIKQIPLSVYPLTKQLSSPKPTTNTSLEPTFAADTKPVNSPNVNSNPNSDSTSSVKTEVKSSPLEKKTASKTNLALKYSVQEIPKFKNNERRNAADEDTDKLASLNKIKELLTQKTAGFGTRSRSNYYPIVRHSSIGNNGAVQTIAKPLPKLLSLELFNPETDDKDSDSSVVSSPDSVGSALVAHGNKKRINSAGPAQTRFLFPSTKTVKTPKKEREKAKAIGKSLAKEFLDAAADVANSLDDAVNKAIASSPRRRDPKPGDVLSVIHRQYTDATPLLSHEAIESSWDDECQRHLTDFADRLSEKLLHEIDQYQEQKRSEAAAASGLSAAAAAASGLSVSAAAAASTNLASSSTSSSSVDIDDDPYIHRLSEELNDLSRLSAEIQKQNEYLARLSAKDRVFVRCVRCKAVKCTCTRSSTTDKSGNNCGGARVINRAATNEKGNESDEGRNAFKNQPSLESCDSSYSLLSGSSLLGNSTESNDSQRETDGKSSERTDSPKDATTTTTSTRFSGEGGGGGSSGSTTVSLQSLTSCPDWKPFKSKSSTNRSDAGDVKGPNRVADHAAAGKEGASFVQTYSDTSQESLPSSDGNNVGGEIIYHRFYHVFREGELDQLIEKYVENLHIISSYYDRSSWCVVAEKVQVWTI